MTFFVLFAFALLLDEEREEDYMCTDRYRTIVVELERSRVYMYMLEFLLLHGMY